MGIPWYSRSLNRFFWIGLWVNLSKHPCPKSIQECCLHCFSGYGWTHLKEGPHSGALPLTNHHLLWHWPVRLLQSTQRGHLNSLDVWPRHRAQEKLTSKTFSMIPSRDLHRLRISFASPLDRHPLGHTRNITRLGSSSCRITTYSKPPAKSLPKLDDIHY